jgi:hypothetical protein
MFPIIRRILVILVIVFILSAQSVVTYRAGQAIDLSGASSVLAPTPSANDNTTKIATTAFVTTAIANGGLTLTAPVQANWTAFNTTGMVQAPTFGTSRWEMASNSSGTDNIQGVALALPTVPYSKIYREWCFTPAANFSACGVGWADGTVGTPGKIATCAVNGSSSTPQGSVMAAGNYNSTTSFNGSITLATGNAALQVSSGVPIWFRISDDNTNWKCEISYDYNGTSGNFYTIFTETRNTFLTATQLISFVNFSSGKTTKQIFDSFK